MSIGNGEPVCGSVRQGATPRMIKGRAELFLAATVLLAVFFPNPALIAAAVITLAAQVVIGSLRLATLVPFGTTQTASSPATDAPYFSVHVAVHNEPPEMVIRTLQALEAQVGAPPFEIFVIDNNTSVRDKWVPVRDFCLSRPRLFRFWHLMGMKGAKAAALDFALDQADPRATHVITIDADYAARPDLLATAAAELKRSGSDYLQFPQAYSMTDTARGAELELSDYFDRAARFGCAAGALLLTGTLSVVPVAALHRVGGWSSRTLTEDAELGVRLARQGYRGSFVPDVMGRGLLPLSLPDFETQRWRWAAGNLQTLMLHARVRDLVSRQGLAVLAQLTAWLNLMHVGFVGMTVAGLFLASGLTESATAGWLFAVVVVLGVLSDLVPLAVGLWRRACSLQDILRAMAVRLSLMPSAAAATLAAAFNLRARFRVTPKDPSGATGAAVPQAALQAVVSVTIAAGLALAAAPFWAAPLVGALPLLGVAPTTRILKAYRVAKLESPA